MCVHNRHAMVPVRRARQWRWWRPAAWLVLILALLLGLLWWFPASWAWTLTRTHLPQVQLTAPSGTVWNGHADVSVRGRALGALDWHVSHATLWGSLSGRMRLQSRRWSVRGDFRRSAAHQIDVDHLRARFPASLLGTPQWLRGLQPGGTVRVDIAHLRLRGNWPVQCAGVLQWRHATLTDARTTARLGDLSAHVGMRAGTTLEATFGDSGTGPLALDGKATATSLGWRLRLNMRTRGHHPGLQRMLMRLGHVQADGSVQVQRRAGLFSRRTP